MAGVGAPLLPSWLADGAFARRGPAPPSSSAARQNSRTRRRTALKDESFAPSSAESLGTPLNDPGCRSEPAFAGRALSIAGDGEPSRLEDFSLLAIRTSRVGSRHEFAARIPECQTTRRSKPAWLEAR